LAELLPSLPPARMVPNGPGDARFLAKHWDGLEVGPTMVGDEHSDPGLMSFLGATKRNMLGNH
ncbi:PREDICTED: GTP cyclohydrolase 1 feedback regulatory protein-like, partial [Eurypyga helias]|uniref:GTP cyclohydrolase 1 feedback regulatory protein-like n=1 Tax=Eurypyga helias TaxID=54383 RepID=UPI0005285E6D